jgi:hypothetical protein
VKPNEDELVFYNGERMAAYWPQRIREAQTIRHARIGGRTFDRVAYGAEGDDWGADDHACHDCRVLKGQLHVPGCDVERCPACGGQAIGCDCDRGAR